MVVVSSAAKPVTHFELTDDGTMPTHLINIELTFFVSNINSNEFQDQHSTNSEN